MRGWGAALTSSESAIDTLAYPDWGWGDEGPQSWDLSTLDYGWGSDRGDVAPAYIIASARNIADDGGYVINIKGAWPRRGASVRQRPTGFAVTLIDTQGVRWPCYSGRAGQGLVCSADIRGSTLSAYSPAAPTGAYDVEVEYDNTVLTVGSVTLVRRTRTREEYALKSALPMLFATGARGIEYETLLTPSAPSANEEDNSTLSVLLRVLGQTLADFNATGVVTRLLEPVSTTDTTLRVESTLGFSASGAVRVGGVLFTYTSISGDVLNGLSRPLGQLYSITEGAEVSHDPHIVTD